METQTNSTDRCSFCGAPAVTRSKYTGNYSCMPSSNQCPANRKKNSTALRSTIAAVKLVGKIDYKTRYDNLSDDIKRRMAWSKDRSITTTELLFTSNSNASTGTLKKRIIKENLKPLCCAICSITKWNGVAIGLELDHINGDHIDNRLENLRLLCPNCHSLTPTYKGKNKNKKQVSEEVLCAALRETAGNIRQALIKVGLSPKGGNYTRAARLEARISNAPSN